MDKKINEVSGIYGEDSSNLKPSWQTSGLTTGSQVLSGTAGYAVSISEPSTAVNDFCGYFEIIEIDQEIPVKPILEKRVLEISIEKARQEMKSGEFYLTHADVFGD